MFIGQGSREILGNIMSSPYIKDLADLKEMSNLNVAEEEDIVECLHFLENGTEEKNNEMLNPNNLYLDIFATYHSAVVYWYLKNIQKSRTVLHGHFNAGTTLTDKKGYYGMYEMWINNKLIHNLMYITQLEENCYFVTDDMQG